MLCLSSIDFDALAACLCISKLYPGTVPVKATELERPVQMFMGIYRDFVSFKELKDIDKNDVNEVFVVDTRPSRKLSEFLSQFKNLKRCIIFDHHVGSKNPVGCRLVEKEVGSTTTMLVPILKQRKIYISPQEATIMLTAIYEDTATLISPTTTPKDLEACAHLLSLGGNLQTVRRFLGTALDQRGKDILKLFLDNIEVVPMGGILVAISCVRYKAYVNNLAFITHKLFDLIEADAIFTASSMAGQTYFVGRSLDDRLVDASKILSHFGGGGHKTASAAKIKGELDPIVAFLRLKAICEDEIVKPPTVTTIMSSPVKVVNPETPISEAKRLIQRFGHGGLPVVNQDKLIGIITRRDLDKVPDDFDKRPVKRYMTSNVLTIEPSASIVEARRLMMRKSVGRLPVIQNGQVLGIVTRSDVLKAAFWHRGQDIGPFSPPTRLGKRETKKLFSKLPTLMIDQINLFSDVASQMGVKLYLVGGAVRDMVMGKVPSDLDFLVEGDAIVFASVISKKVQGKLAIHERFGTARIILDNLQIDLATARAEYYTQPGAQPNVQRSSIREDILRRDFTVNALALGLTGSDIENIVDFCGGLEDVASKRVRILHNLSFVEDPSRILRAVYYSSLLGFEVEKETKKLALDAIKTGLLTTAKNERTGQELEKILVHPKATEMLITLEKMGGGLSAIFSGLPQKFDSQLKKVDKVAKFAKKLDYNIDLRILRVIAISAEIDLASLTDSLARMKLSGKLVDYVKEARDVLPTLTGALESNDPVSIFKACEDLEDSSIIYAVSSWKIVESLKILQLISKIRGVKLEITGNDLIKAGIKPSKTLGDVLKTVLFEKVNGKVSGFDAELKLARELING